MSAFYLKTRTDLANEIERLGLEIPVAGDNGALHQPFRIGSHEAPNRLCALPMAGDDLEPDGSPSAYTIRRYQRSARRGFGTLWFEATELAAAGGFSVCVDAVRAISPDALLILQLWPTSGEVEATADAAMAAEGAGFDGVDIACCYGNRLTEDPGRLLPIVKRVRRACPDSLLAVRLEVYQAKPEGFGVDANDYRRMDLAEPIALARAVQEAGVALLSVTASSPNLFGRPREPIPDGVSPHEHPLTVLARHQEMARQIRAEVPGLILVGGGYSWLRRFAPAVAAGAIESGIVDVIGWGRLGVVEHSLLTFAEEDLWESGGPFGRQPAGDAAYRDARLRVFDEIADLEDNELVRAFREGDVEGAYRVLCQTHPLPEMTSHIRTDAWERDTNIKRQLQYVIAWTARRMGLTGVILPGRATGRRIAVIGGGPAGLAATVRLLEAGHEVVLLEREDRLGGAPALVYPEDRVPDPSGEIQALLDPAESAGRLTIALGREASPDELLDTHDAVLVATGCWNEPSLGVAEGVWSALHFLKAARRGELTHVPARVLIVCGGDAAMDAAVTAKRLGAEQLVLFFDGSRESAHWHLPDEWFETEGVQARFESRAVGVRVKGGVILENGETADADMMIEAMGLYADEVETESEKLFTAGSGASVAQSMREALSVADDIDQFLRGGCA